MRPEPLPCVSIPKPGCFVSEPVRQAVQTALHDLGLTYPWVVYPGTQAYQGDKRISVLPIHNIPDPVHQLILSTHINQTTIPSL